MKYTATVTYEPNAPLTHMRKRFFYRVDYLKNGQPVARRAFVKQEAAELSAKQWEATQ